MQPKLFFVRITSERSFRKSEGSDNTEKTDFREIVECYGDMVYRIALSHTLDKAYAEDIFQEVFLSLAENYEKLESDLHLKHWLIRTAINRAVSHNRKHSRKKLPSAVTETVDDTAFGELKIIIEELPEKYRTVIFLCCYEGYTVKEAAHILKKSVGTVKSQLARAKKLLKSELEGNL